MVSKVLISYKMDCLWKLTVLEPVRKLGKVMTKQKLGILIPAPYDWEGIFNIIAPPGLSGICFTMYGFGFDGGSGLLWKTCEPACGTGPSGLLIIALSRLKPSAFPFRAYDSISGESTSMNGFVKYWQKIYFRGTSCTLKSVTKKWACEWKDTYERLYALALQLLHQKRQALPFLGRTLAAHWWEASPLRSDDGRHEIPQMP